jgi:hypothetical protein
MEALHAAGVKAELREGEVADAQRGLPVPLAPLAAQQAAAGVSPEAVHGDFAAGLAAVPELKVELPDRDRSPGPRAAAKLGRAQRPLAKVVPGRGRCCQSRLPIGTPYTEFRLELNQR